MVEILVLGTGDRIMLVKGARETLAKMGVQLDVQDTVCHPWMELTTEKRCEHVQSIAGGGKERCSCSIGTRES